MTVKFAVDILKNDVQECLISHNAKPEMITALKAAIKALEKEEPYRPSEAKLIIGVGRCKCGVEFLDKETYYCGNCGQRLDWTKSER